MDRDSDDPISRWLDQTATDPAGGTLAMKVTRLQGASFYATPPRRRSVAVSVVAASGDPTLPTVNGFVVFNGDEVRLLSDYPGFQLQPVQIAVGDGDDVLVVEMWDAAEVTPTPPPPTHESSLLLEDGFVLLLESGDRLLLE